MISRIIEFITALRAAGVRVSVAESADALRAIEQAGVSDKAFFRAALQSTLIKDAQDIPTFQRLFPMYFTDDLASPRAPGIQGSLRAAEQHLLQQAFQQALETMDAQQLAPLFQALVGGERVSDEQIAALLSGLRPLNLSHPYYQNWLTQRALRELGVEQLDRAWQQLLDQLQAAGMDAVALETIAQAAGANRQALVGQVGQHVARQRVAQALAEQAQRDRLEELLDKPFERLNHQETVDLRNEVTRLAARLRSRAELRRRRGKKGVLDAKATIRSNLRFGGVPLKIRHRRRHLKPKLVVICDVSTSMRAVVSFMLLLVYGLQDQVSRTRSFAFVADLEEISADFVAARPAQAVEQILTRIPARFVRTDLGQSLQTFVRDYLGCVDQRSTIIILGDGRNNFYDPGLAALKTIKDRARRLIWFNPEPRNLWKSGDSDMLAYEPLCDAVHVVGNLRQLADAVDSLFG
jgi:hypothetical protein